DGGAATSDGGAAYLFVTDLAGITAVDVVIEDSADGSTGWATIATFAQVTADNAGQRVEITGAIKQHTRASIDVTGTGSAKILAGSAPSTASPERALTHALPSRRSFTTQARRAGRARNTRRSHRNDQLRPVVGAQHVREHHALRPRNPRHRRLD